MCVCVCVCVEGTHYVYSTCTHVPSAEECRQNVGVVWVLNENRNGVFIDRDAVSDALSVVATAAAAAGATATGMLLPLPRR